MIKTIIFDVGGVITKTDFKTIYSNFGRRIGLEPQIVIDYHQTKVDDLLLGNISLEQFWKDMIAAGADPDAEFEKIWIEEGVRHREINTELLEIIERLRKNFSVGILTNLTPSRLILDKEMKLYSHFDYAILSCEEHLKKPDPDFYQLALKAASARPEEAVFIDDKMHHTSAGEQVGIRSIIYFYPDNKKLSEEFKKLGIQT